MEITNLVLSERFEVNEFISQGGMGRVYKGRDRQTGEPVAIKHLKSETIDAEPTLVERFVREGDALRALNHPNIVKMLAAIEQDHQHYLVMEYVSGGSLTDLLNKENKLPIKRVVQIGLDLSDALIRSHRLKIIHRDIKPANVLLAEDGTPRLTDYGIARIGDSTMTSVGEIVGTYAYLSPESLNGDVLDTRADIWSFGVLLYEMLAGKRPFDEQGYAPLIKAILQSTPPDLEVLRPDAPIALIDLIYRMLEKDREQRISSVRLVGAELEAIAQAMDSHSTAPVERLARSHSTPATPTPTTEPFPNNLPLQTTPFVGRESELAEVSRLIHDPAIRLITVLAPGGMGKTRLGIEAASRELMTFKDGVFFVALASLDEVCEIVPAIAQAVRLTFFEGLPQADQLLTFLQSKHMLLVFDNFEHLLGGSDIVSDIIQRAPDVTVLATSRERLNLEAETVLRLSGMDFPDWETPENAAEYSAVKLFLQSARRVQPDFALSSDNLGFIARICRLVVGMPLGIVLAASWVELLSLPEIATEIERNIDFLETEQRDVPARQRSLRAVFDYSWKLLSEADRDAYKKLSIFLGKFTREAAQQITGASLRTLMSLVNKSLLNRDPVTGAYEVHTLLRQFAAQELTRNAEQALEIGNQHSAYYLKLLQHYLPYIQGRDQHLAFSAIELEMTNYSAAWEWAAAHRHIDALTESFETLFVYFLLNTRVQEGEKLLAPVLDIMRAGATTEKQKRMLGLMLIAYASSQIMTKPGPNLTAYFNEGDQLLQSLGAERELAIAAMSAVFFTDWNSMIDRLERAIDVMRHSDDKWWLGQALATTAQGLVAIPNMLQGSRTLLDEAYQVCKSIGDTITLQQVIFLLAEVAYREGKNEEAIRYINEGNSLKLPIEAPFEQVYIDALLGIIYCSLGEMNKAWQVTNRGLVTARKVNMPFLNIEILLTAGRLALTQQDIPAAKVYMEEALNLALSQGHFDFRRNLGSLYSSLGAIHLVSGDMLTSQEYFRQGFKKSLEYGILADILESVSGLAAAREQEDTSHTGLAILYITRTHPEMRPVPRQFVEQGIAMLESGLSAEALATAHALSKTLVLEQIIEDFKARYLK